jgi:C4-type Zn-finger protein
MGNYPSEPATNCPSCQRPMASIDRKPILFTDSLIDVTYMCEWCGTETKRAVREQIKPPRAGRTRHDDRYGLVTR